MPDTRPLLTSAEKDQLKQARIAGMSRADCSMMWDVPEETIRKWEQRGNWPTPEQIVIRAKDAQALLDARKASKKAATVPPAVLDTVPQTKELSWTVENGPKSPDETEKTDQDSENGTVGQPIKAMDAVLIAAKSGRMATLADWSARACKGLLKRPEPAPVDLTEELALVRTLHSLDKSSNGGSNTQINVGVAVQMASPWSAGADDNPFR